ncbi:chaperone NapD [Thiovibrio frasassiensis]|jgi:nitrate reductase NapD|uniref:Chaperone NapD n=1 Tax=Thiovibrio frasassiensis TaxID=2984131 RepID=A0A9X4RPW6_9BACT|nr:chaperone NapD [Thiovibrio frasassiensis]MDG4475642.1 chaperone NapD [Thiovibrio frasassiensis]
MNIAGVLVHARPDSSAQVAVALGQMPGLEIHARTEDHRFVITIEEHEQAVISETLLALYRVEGVLSASMVYQHCEQEEGATP